MKNILRLSILCAATAAVAQPEMPGELFAKLAADWYLTDQCAFGGHIKPETAAYGKQLLRQSLDTYQTDMAAFMRLVDALNKTRKIGLPSTKTCNVIAVQIEEIRLQVAAAEAKAQADAEQQRDAQVKAELRQRQLREEQMAAQTEAYRQQQIRAANAADNRREIEQLEQQFRDFGNSFRPRTTNCTRTMMGASCTTY